MLYESHLVGHFHYLWGYEDHAGLRQPRLALLSNQQNPLDALLGDVVGDSDGRWFVIEFKRRYGDFERETSGPRAKPDRKALVDALMALPADAEQRSLSVMGHFAAYERHRRIQFAPYVWAAGTSFTPRHPCDDAYPGIPMEFPVFYGRLNLRDHLLCAHDPLFHRHGLGLTPAGMRGYLDAMLRSTASPETAEGAETKIAAPSTQLPPARPSDGQAMHGALDTLFGHASEAGLAFAHTTIKRLLLAYARRQPAANAANDHGGGFKPASSGRKPVV